MDYAKIATEVRAETDWDVNSVSFENEIELSSPHSSEEIIIDVRDSYADAKYWKDAPPFGNTDEKSRCEDLDEILNFIRQYE